MLLLGCNFGAKLKLDPDSTFGVGYTAARFAAGVWKKLETEPGGFCVEGGCCVSGGELVSRKDSHDESIWAFISFDLTPFPQIGHATMVELLKRW